MRKYREQKHSIYWTLFHIVWTPKYRLRVFNPGLAGFIGKSLIHSVKSMPGVEIQEQNVQPDHVHVMMLIPPKYSVAEVVNQMKGFSSRVARRAIPWLRKRYHKKELLWSRGYFVSTVGIDELTIRNYIRHQQDLDSGQAELEL